MYNDFHTNIFLEEILSRILQSIFPFLVPVQHVTLQTCSVHVLGVMTTFGGGCGILFMKRMYEFVPSTSQRWFPEEWREVDNCDLNARL